MLNDWLPVLFAAPFVLLLLGLGGLYLLFPEKKGEKEWKRISKQQQTTFDAFAAQKGWRVLDPKDVEKHSWRPFLKYPFPKDALFPDRDETETRFTWSQVAEKKQKGVHIWLVFDMYTTYAHEPGERPEPPKVNTPENFDTWLFYVLAVFDRTLPGQVRIGPEKGLTSKLRRDLELESVEFNRKVFIASNPPKLRQYVLHPDFMDWYMRLPKKPWVTIAERSCTIIMQGEINQNSLGQFTDQALRIARYISRSGALEKKSKPLLPPV